MKPSLIIAGLGNPGNQYTATRHNMGYRAVELLASGFDGSAWKQTPKFQAEISEGRIVTVPVLFVKPQTYMNLSGDAVKKIIQFYDMDPASQLLVICDDIDLPPGEVRLRMNGGPGTHNGLKSLIDHFGRDFPRLRIGIGSQEPGEDLSNYVLSRPTAEDIILINKSLENLPAIVKEFVL